MIFCCFWPAKSKINNTHHSNYGTGTCIHSRQKSRFEITPRIFFHVILCRPLCKQYELKLCDLLAKIRKISVLQAHLRRTLLAEFRSYIDRGGIFSGAPPYNTEKFLQISIFIIFLKLGNISSKTLFISFFYDALIGRYDMLKVCGEYSKRANFDHVDIFANLIVFACFQEKLVT